MEGCRLLESICHKARFVKTDLTYADFSHTDATAADFSQSNLTGTNLHKTELIGAILGGTNRKDALETDPDLAEARSLDTRVLKEYEACLHQQNREGP